MSRQNRKGEFSLTSGPTNEIMPRKVILSKIRAMELRTFRGIRSRLSPRVPNNARIACAAVVGPGFLDQSFQVKGRLPAQ